MQPKCALKTRWVFGREDFVNLPVLETSFLSNNYFTSTAFPFLKFDPSVLLAAQQVIIEKPLPVLYLKMKRKEGTNT